MAPGSGFKEGQGGSCGDSFMKAVLLMDDAGEDSFITKQPLTSLPPTQMLQMHIYYSKKTVTVNAEYTDINEDVDPQ